MTDDLLAGTADELFADLCPPDAVDAAQESGWAAPVWEALEQAQMTLLPIAEDKGGSGAGLVETATLLRAAGRHAVPIPLAETALLAGWLLAGSGLSVPGGPLAAAAPTGITIQRGEESWRLSGRIPRVPWARMAQRLVLLVTDGPPAVLSLDASSYTVEPGRNVAGEPRDDVVLDRTVVPADSVAKAGPHLTRDAFLLRGALGRSLLMAGAADRVLEMTVQYAGERVQFGRPISRFQAVQQHLAEMAGAVSATGVAAEAAARDAQADGPLATLRVAAAKEQAGRAAGTVTRLAHQVHGAIGFTREHNLRLWTTRLWAWRDEFGTDDYWARVVGRRALAAGAGGLWPLLSS